MTSKHFSILIAFVLCIAGGARADEVAVASRVESIGLFKNGLASIRRIVQLPRPGLYRLDTVPNAVHGTFWIESSSPITARATWREVEKPADGSVNFQQDLAGQQVMIHFRDGSLPPVNGKVVEIARTEESASPVPYDDPYRGRRAYVQPASSPYLVLETPTGRMFVDASQIAYIAAEGPADTIKRRSPVLLLGYEGEGDQPVTVAMTYLARGLAWAPSYRINLDDSKTLALEQQAVIKNELEDFADVDLKLISGFPSIQFAHVLSPMSLDTSWANFFNQLNQHPSAQSALTSNVSQQRVSFQDAGDTGIDYSAIPTGEGVDLHFQPIGKQTMAKGDAMSMSIAKAQAEYERIVEWIVPDTRDEYGRYIEEHRREQNPDRYQDAAWDSIKFKNPLAFAMTTAPAMISANGQFNGQRMSYWVNAGEQTTIQITKALSLRTRAVEQEQQGEERDLVYIGGARHQKVAVDGELTVSNHRAEPIKLIVRRQFSGELTSADQQPRVTLREEGVYSINRRNELAWTIELPPGETQTLKYTYTVLVRN